jgi:hypothetical protein
VVCVSFALHTKAGTVVGSCVHLLVRHRASAGAASATRDRGFTSRDCGLAKRDSRPGHRGRREAPQVFDRFLSP